MEKSINFIAKTSDVLLDGGSILLFPPLNKSTAQCNGSARSFSSRNIPSPRSTAGCNRGKALEGAASRQLAGVTQADWGPLRMRACSPSTLGPRSLEAARTFWRHQLVQQSHSEDSSGKAQRGVARAGRRLLRGAGSTVAGGGGRGNPTFGCLP